MRAHIDPGRRRPSETAMMWVCLCSVALGGAPPAHADLHPILHEPVGPPTAPASPPPSDSTPPPPPSSDEVAPDRLKREPTVDPDRQTGPEPPGPHPYYEVFDPAVYPWKRMSAFDRVVLGPCAPARVGCLRERMTVAKGALTPLVRHAMPPQSSDVFVGQVRLPLSHRWSALPSPGAPIELDDDRAIPGAALQFAVDSADNLWVRTRGPGGGEPSALTYRVAIAASYFGGALPTSARLGDEPPVNAVPPQTLARAAKVWRAIGVAPERAQPLAPLVTKLVAWFRGFAVGDPPAEVDGDFVDLALARRGSCRHRSFAFTVTALSLGIPTRMVQNELHVYVEIFVPTSTGGGWRRIDLGGALLDPLVIDEAHRPRHRPRGSDPFAAAKPPTNPVAEPNHAANATASISGGSSQDRPTAPRSEAAPKRVTATIALALDHNDVFAGDVTTVHGAVHVQSGSAAGLPVEIWLDGDTPLRLGSTVSGADGTFVVEVQLPADVPLGAHRVIARQVDE